MQAREPPKRRPLPEHVRRKLDRPLCTLLEAGDEQAVHKMVLLK